MNRGLYVLFHALTDAPELGEGVKLNIMAVPQVAETAPPRLDVGSRLTIRFGRCCPDEAEGIITAVAAQPERAVLSLGDADWILQPAPSAGVAILGIVSEHWVVC